MTNPRWFRELSYQEHVCFVQDMHLAETSYGYARVEPDEIPLFCPLCGCLLNWVQFLKKGSTSCQCGAFIAWG